MEKELQIVRETCLKAVQLVAKNGYWSVVRHCKVVVSNREWMPMAENDFVCNSVALFCTMVIRKSAKDAKLNKKKNI